MNIGKYSVTRLREGEALRPPRHGASLVIPLGPVLAYLTDCGGDCPEAGPAALSWLKIDERGLSPGYPVRRRPRLLRERPPQHDQRDSGRLRCDDPKSQNSRNDLLRAETIIIGQYPLQFYAALTGNADGTATPGAEYFVKFPGSVFTRWFFLSSPAYAHIVEYRRKKRKRRFLLTEALWQTRVFGLMLPVASITRKGERSS
ncbi:hypothetical protein SLS62_003349 [Diatrype stigma]|uniref:Uncharacterized protein n=1 Tax=Diatrype stigma TaxID=117547 RepID=A0AAN9UWK0_9PEZI